MSVKSVMEKLTANEGKLMKRTLIIAGTVVALGLTAGLLMNKDAVSETVDSVIDAANDLTA